MSILSDELVPLYRKSFSDSEAWINHVFNQNVQQIANYAYIQEDGKCVSAVFTRNKKLRIKNKVVEFPYIFGLCTDQEYRRQGKAKSVITEILEQLYNKESSIVMLTPANDDLFEYYRKLNFIGFNYRTVENASHLIDEETEFVDGKICEESASIMTDIFNRNAKTFFVAQYRTNNDSLKRLEEAIADGGRLVLLSKKSNTYGYFLIDSDDKIEEAVSDFKGSNNIIYPKIPAVFLSPIFNSLSDIDCEQNDVTFGSMIRVVNPMKLFEDLGALYESQNINVNITVRDNLISDSSFNLKVVNGKTFVTKSFDIKANDYIIDNLTLTRWMLGIEEKVEGLPVIDRNINTAFYEEW